MLVQPFLSYVICSLQHESEDTVKKAVLQYFTHDEIVNVNVNVNVHAYIPDIPVGSADCTIYTPGIGTHYCYLSHLLWG